MTYRIIFRPTALLQLHGFPGDALDTLVPVMADVSLYPDDPLRSVPTAVPGRRRADFGVAGMVTYDIDETARLVTVRDVTWVG